MKPQDYSTRARYRPPAAWYQRLNWLGVPLTSLGLAPRDAVTLGVRGRKSGKARRIPILRTRYQGDDYLVSLAGESQWVRNVRADHGRAVIRRRGARHVRLEELAPDDRGEIIAEYLRAGRGRSGAKANAQQFRYYFGLEPRASPAAIAAIADYYPVFRIHYEDQSQETTMSETTPAPGRRQSANQASAGGGNAVYGLGLIGALVFFWQQADSFGGYLLAVLKALVWPAFLVYEAFQQLRG